MKTNFRRTAVARLLRTARRAWLTACMARDNLPVISFESGAAWQSWLEAEHASSPGVWLKIAKKGASQAAVSYPDRITSAQRPETRARRIAKYVAMLAEHKKIHP